MTEHTGLTNYDMGVEFTDLADEDTTLLKTFIDYFVRIERKDNG
jgi:hypothetical protein